MGGRAGRMGLATSGFVIIDFLDTQNNTGEVLIVCNPYNTNESQRAAALLDDDAIDNENHVHSCLAQHLQQQSSMDNDLTLYMRAINSVVA